MKTSELHQEKQPTAKTERMTGAEALVRCLIEENVKTLFGYPGGAIMPIYDELYKYQEQLRHILVRHEQGAVHAADAYARVTGEVGVALLTSGPGATNLLTGVANAYLDSVPMLVVTGQAASQSLGKGAAQETNREDIDIVEMFRPVTKYSTMVTSAESLPHPQLFPQKKTGQDRRRHDDVLHDAGGAGRIPARDRADGDVFATDLLDDVLEVRNRRDDLELRHGGTGEQKDADEVSHGMHRTTS